ncbi:hypothetical protein GWI33_013240 [Rhynchophorus ferrugineus]|uniref:Leucine-rich repeat protein soc-2 homolog n=1 Tax=Rhynchophorus ferrugineus TaxID=354439 RepID=A0A834MBR8_RHYFE|nr:hypothetical protein GWI33_013240 [Rhynchophorus ferrugineus]
MGQKVKINVKERYTDGEIDLSMSDLDEVPVKEIALLKKTVSLDLSNNRLINLPINFSTLTNLTKLDLSKNEITELPEDFGALSKLTYLDLYRNKLQHLPLSFGQLTGLKFLDLKDNPLVPAIAKVAGPCLDTKGCHQCAKDIVTFYKRLQSEVNTEMEIRNKARQKQLEINRQKKLEEKKKVKKEKQKAKKENTEKLIKNNTEKISKKEPKKNKTPQKKKQKKISIGSLIFWLIIILFFVVWVLTSIQHPWVDPLISTLNLYFENLLSKIPPEYRPYGISCINSVKVLQVYTRNITLKAIEFVNTDKNIQEFFNRIKESYYKLTEASVTSK